MEVRSANDFDKAFAMATTAGVGAVAIGPNSPVAANQKRVAEVAVKHRLASIWQLSEFVDVGGLWLMGRTVPTYFAVPPLMWIKF